MVQGGPGKKRAPRPPEVRAKIAASMTGKKHSEASKRKMSASQLARYRRERAQS